MDTIVGLGWSLADITILVLLIFSLFACIKIRSLSVKNKAKNSENNDNAFCRKRNKKIARFFMRELSIDKLEREVKKLRDAFQEIETHQSRGLKLPPDLEVYRDDLDFYRHLANLIDKEIGKIKKP